MHHTATEQSQLPYKWRQTLQDVDMSLPLAAGTRSKQIVYKLDKKHLFVSVLGEVIIDGDLFNNVKLEDSTWLSIFVLI